MDNLANIGQQLGAHAVLASLWSVNDKATALFMEEFYRVRQRNPGMTKAEALQEAQRAMLEGRLKPQAGSEASEPKGGSADPGKAPAYQRDPDKPFAHPYYWAPFVLMGNWK